MDKEEIHALLNVMPPNVMDYADDLVDLNREDIPWERVPKIKEIIRNGEDEYNSLRAAVLLANWGIEEGVSYLESYVRNRTSSVEVLIPHRLRNYDDTYAQVLHAVVGYWANRADAGAGDEARKRLFGLISEIIQLSNNQPFEISHFFWLVQKKHFTEYLPALKEHFTAILKHPELHHWKIIDCAHLLIKFNPEFVERALAAEGKTLADFPNK